MKSRGDVRAGGHGGHGPGLPKPTRGLDGWPDDRVPRRVRFRVALMETALALAREGEATAYLPAFVVDRHNRAVKAEHALEELEAPKRIAGPQPVYAIKRKAEDESRAFRALCRVLRSLR